MAENKILLKTENVSEVFGGLKAVADFNFYINKGELIGLIGPNGAGKTTIFNLITGVYVPTTGEIKEIRLSEKSLMKLQNAASLAPSKIFACSVNLAFWTM